MRTESILRQCVIEQRRAEERKIRKLESWSPVNTITIGGYALAVVYDATMLKGKIKLVDTFAKNSLIHFGKTVV